MIVSLKEALINVAFLEKVRTGTNPTLDGRYLSLIKRGTCFLPYVTSGGLAFAPSRFIGYAANNFAKHDANTQRDGRETNSALDAVLHRHATPNVALEKHYVHFCMTIGVSPSRTGAFGVQRKYWVTPEISERLDQLAEAEVLADPAIPQTEKERLVKSRIGQGIFRDSLIAKWTCCCMSGCDITTILRASHIKPWRDSDNQERLDVFNGLLLSPNMDALFDMGLVSFKDDGTLLISSRIAREELTALGCKPDLRLKFENRHAKYLRFHRSTIFADQRIDHRKQ
nr:HNH endonuclease [Plastoroseomonas hellenica]